MKLSTNLHIGGYVPQSEGGFDISNYGTIVIAASFRKINSNYTGPLIRIRRASDNVEQNFGSSLSLGEFVDDVEIATFLGGTGSSLGFITRIFDQSTNGFDYLQSSASRQPRYFDPVIPIGIATPKAFFDGTDDLLQADTGSLKIGKSTSTQTTFIVTQSSTYGFEALTTAGNDPTNNNGLRQYRLIRSSSYARMSYLGDVTDPLTNTSAPSTISAPEIFTLNANKTVATFKRNNTNDITATLTASQPNGVRYSNLMSGSATTWSKQGLFHEYILFDSALSAANELEVYSNLESTYIP